MRNAAKWTVTAALLTAAACAGGCAQRGLVVGAEATLPADEMSPEFLDRMSSQTDATQNDAARGMLLLLDGKDEAGTFGRRVAELRRRGLAPDDWDWSAGQPIPRDRMAYLVYRACKIPGGATLTIFGPSRRYCLKELQYQGMISPGFGHTAVSGMEMVAILTRADAYLQTGQVPTLIQTAAE